MANGHAPAGWYPDPAGNTTIVRYWDGQAWTEQTQPMVSQEQLNHIGMPPVTPAPVYAPGQAIPSYAIDEPVKNRKGPALAGMILGIVSIVLCCFSWVDIIIAIVAIVLSAVGIKSTRKKMAITGIILGVVGIIAAAIMWVVLLDIINDPTKYGLSSDYFSALGY